jgi:predicted DNA-binding transcriptional regulator YafY
MRHDKLDRELKLLLLLIENHNYTVPEICDRIGISRRNLYYYLEFFRDIGFKVENTKPYYRIRKDSPWFRKLNAAVQFSEDEALLMHQIIEKTDDDSPQVQQLLHKLNKIYDFDITEKVEMREQVARNLRVISEAIKMKRVVVLEGYSSPHSNTTSDRTVEPFMLLNGNLDVRCYEPSAKMNKTFKLSRVRGVQMLDLLWSNEQYHREMFTDVFMFSGEQPTIVKLRLGRLSYAILREEYPRSEQYITQEDDSHWLAEIPVCSYLGIGRFVLGLLEDIEVVDNDEFCAFLREKICEMAQKMNNKQ